MSAVTVTRVEENAIATAIQDNHRLINGVTYGDGEAFYPIYKIYADEFEQNASYLLLFRMHVNDNCGSTQNTILRLAVEGDDKGPEFQPGHNVIDCAHFAWYIETGDTPDDVTLLAQCVGSETDTDFLESLHVLVRLDDHLQKDVDFFASTTITQANNSNSYTDIESVTFTPASGTNKYLAIAQFSADTPSDGTKVAARLTLDGATSGADSHPEAGPRANTGTVTGLGDRGGPCLPLMKLYENLSVASHTIRLQGKDNNTSSPGTKRGSSLIVIDLATFDEVTGAYTDGTFNYTTATNFEEVEDMSYTPTTAGNFFILAAFTTVGVAGSSPAAKYIALDNNGTYYNITTSGESGVREQSQAGGDGAALLSFAYENLPASLQDISVDYRNNVNNTEDPRHRTWIIFSAEAGNPPMQLSGNVKEEGANVSRTVEVHRRVPPYDKLRSVVSNGTTGNYTADQLPAAIKTPKDVIVQARDAAGGSSYNDLVHNNIDVSRT